MLPRLEAERDLNQVNLAFATANREMEDLERQRFLGELMQRARPPRLSSPDEVHNAGIMVVAERLTGGVDAPEPPKLYLPPGVGR